MSDLFVPRISVVIPTANRSDSIGKTIAKIYQNTIQPNEVIIVDQSLDDLTLKAIESFIRENKLTYIKDEGTGASRSRNIGWRAASGDIIAFTDDDAFVTLNWLESIRYTYQEQGSNIGVVTGRTLPFFEEKNPDWSIPEKWKYLLPIYDQGDTYRILGEGDAFPWGVNFSVFRDLLQKLNGFDETLGVNSGRTLQIMAEDIDLAQRIKKSGFDLVYNPNCIVYHPVTLSRQTQDFLNKRLMYEGATYAYRDIKNAKPSFLNISASLFKSLTRYWLMLLSKGNQEDAHYLYGKMLILVKVGILQIQH